MLKKKNQGEKGGKATKATRGGSTAKEENGEGDCEPCEVSSCVRCKNID